MGQRLPPGGLHQRGRLLFSPPAGASPCGGGRCHGDAKMSVPSCHSLFPGQPPPCLHLIRTSLQALSHTPGSPWQLPPRSRWPQGVLETLDFENRQMQKVCCGVFPFPPSALSLLSAPRLPPAPLTCILPGQQLSACRPACLSVPSTPCRPLASARNTPGLC